MIFEQPLTVLIANIYLTGRSGTEIITRDVAFALRRAGHRPIVYAAGLGPIAQEIQARGIPVTEDISTIAADVDIIHGNHNQVTAIAAARFPNTPALYFAHDFVAWHSAPPLLANISKYVAVDDTVAGRLQFEAGIPADRIATLLNAVDTDRFVPGPPLPQRPRRALAFAKNIQHLHAVRTACERHDITLDVAGGITGALVTEPETLLPQYDLLFTSALSALEAMACGRAVIVCDGRGLAGMARSDNWEGWRQRNFGLGVLQNRLSPDAISAEIDRYDASDAADVARRTRREAGMPQWLDACLSLYGEAIERHRAEPPTAHELNLSLARHMQTWMPKAGPPWPWMTERAELLARLAQPIEPVPIELRHLTLDEPVSLAQADNPENAMRLTGFSPVEHWGVWTDGELATVECKLSATAAATTLMLSVVPFLYRRHAKVAVELFVNGRKVERRVFRRTARGAPLFTPQDWLVTLPTEIMPGASFSIGFRIENPASPQQIGLSNDERRLGIGLCRIELKP